VHQALQKLEGTLIVGYDREKISNGLTFLYRVKMSESFPELPKCFVSVW